MAITMSSKGIEDSTRKSLTSSEVDTAAIGSEGSINKNDLVGITPAFAEAVSSAIDSYCSNIEKKLNTLQDKSSAQAFRGEEIGEALTKFVEAVKEVSMSYLTKLKQAEQQIISSVETVYSSQDTSISGDLGGDSSTLGGQSLR